MSELLVGYDLAQHLNECGGKLPQGDAVYLIRQCLWGLWSRSHGRGDPSRCEAMNLFVAKDATGQTTLKTDFLVWAKSRGDSELTSTGVIVGTPAYWLWSKHAVRATRTNGSDLYAVGAAALSRGHAARAPIRTSDAGGTPIRLMEEAPPRPSLVERGISPKAPV